MFKRVYVEITNVCNLSCVFCPGTTREKRFLSPEEFRLMAEKLRDHTRYLYFHVMGEPLLHPQLAELLAIAGELGFRVCITTNGTLLSEKSSALLSAPALHKVSVSLHSFEGNDGGDMTDYLHDVWKFCAAASVKGVLCALRLWNEGGAEARNGEALRFLSTMTGTDVETCLLTAWATSVLRRACFWNRPGNSTGRPRMRRRATCNSATPCASRWPYCATARWCPAVWTARAVWRWETC